MRVFTSQCVRLKTVSNYARFALWHGNGLNLSAELTEMENYLEASLVAISYLRADLRVQVNPYIVPFGIQMNERMPALASKHYFPTRRQSWHVWGDSFNERGAIRATDGCYTWMHALALKVFEKGRAFVAEMGGFIRD